MLVTADSRNPVETATDLLVLPIAGGDPTKRRLAGRAAAFDRALDGRISARIEAGDFRGKRDETLLLYPDGAIAAKRLLLLGLGAVRVSATASCPETGRPWDGTRYFAGN